MPKKPRANASQPDDKDREGEGEGTSVRDLVAALGRAESGEAAAETDGDREGGGGVVETLPMDPEDDLSDIEGEAAPELTSIVESLLFASPRPIGVRELRRVLKEPTVRQIQLSLRELVAHGRDRGVVLQQVAGGFAFRTRPDNARWVQALLAAKPVRLSRPQLEVLAVVAYRQPITKPEVDHVRGVDCSAVLRMLMEFDLVQIVGRKEEPGRPHLYGTTVRFLELFNIRGLRDLPDLRESRELSAESEEMLRRELDERVEQERLGQGRFAFGGDAAPATDEAPPEPEPEPEPATEPASEDPQ